MRKYIAEKYSLQASGVTVYREIVPDDPSKPILLSVGKIRKEAICPTCDVVSSYHYDTRGSASRIRHLDYHDRQVYLIVRKKRFRCTVCARVFTEQNPKLFTKYQRTTTHFNYEALVTLKTHNFKDTQKKQDVSFSYLIRQLYGAVPHASTQIDWKKEFEGNETIALGVDEHGFKKRKLVLTVTNVTKKKLITIRPAYTKAEVAKVVRSIPSQYRKRITCVAMDLTNRYSKTIKEYLPHVQIAADHFHVIGLLNRLLWNEKRVIEGVYRTHSIKYFKLLLKGKERLKPWQQTKVAEILEVQKWSRLKTAYELKETMRELLKKGKDKQQAKQEFVRIAHSDVWNRNRCTWDELRKYSKYYRTVIETLKKWEQEIITLIETRVTNGYTEGIHTKIKLLKRMSYGITNEVTYIKRMILALSSDMPTNSFH